MVIPTLRVGEKKSYDEAVSNFLDKSIRMIRVNMTRYSLERYCEDIRYIRERSDNALEIMADIPLPGNKYRIDTAQPEKFIEKGQEIIFAAGGDRKTEGITVEIERFVPFKGAGKIVIGDGELSFTVRQADEDRIIAAADNSAVIRGGRAFIFADAVPFRMYTEELLHKYIDALKVIHPEKIVLSFAEDVNILEDVCKEIYKEIPGTAVIPKIETQKGIDNIDSIFEKYDEVMLGRGDLALFSDIRNFGENQNKVLGAAKKRKKNVIVATDILTSLYELTIPARGELSDIFYLYSMGVEDVVASAGISMQKSLFDRFCDLAGNFMSRTSGETAVQVGGQAGKQTGMQAGETAACR